jgi:glycosyltransferase involved in cell wall biosynthesis
MKILFSSYTFAPNVGGIESVSAILAERFAEAGHEVSLITETEENAERPTPNAQRPTYRIIRRPSLFRLIKVLGWCDLVFQNNISLRSLIPAVLMRRRVIVVHQTWLREQGRALSQAPTHRRTGDRRSLEEGIGWNNRIKRALLPYVANVAISAAIRDDINVPARIIGNPYDDKAVRLIPNIARDKGLVFVGRLVSDKGVDLLLEAMKILRTSEENVQRPTSNVQRPMAKGEHNVDLQFDLTVVGSGPEEEKLRRLARELGLDRQVTFVGQKSGDELARILNQHRVLVVPSRWAEPFGIVALEGIACGCVVVGSRGGGLPEAIGPCGLTFENGNARELADCLKELLLNPAKMEALRKEASAHLAKFRADAVADAYLELIQAPK